MNFRACSINAALRKPGDNEGDGVHRRGPGERRAWRFVRRLVPIAFLGEEPQDKDPEETDTDPEKWTQPRRLL
jgi:hypothetical protein